MQGEQAVKMAAKLYECRDAAQRLLGASVLTDELYVNGTEVGAGGTASE